MSVRRNIRLRKEFLYQQGLRGKEKEDYAKKKVIREALRDGKNIPGELRDEAMILKNKIDLDDARTGQESTHIDDEYASAGVVDPKICVTTSHDPSSRLKQFVKEVKLMFPNSQRVNRGNGRLTEFVDAIRASDFTDLIIVQETRGEPDGMLVCHLPYGPTAHFNLSGTVMRHDMEDTVPMSEQYPHLIFDNFTSKVGDRVMTMLKHLFPVPKADNKRVMTFSNKEDYISFRHHTYSREGGDIELEEIGPRFEMKLFKITLGTVEQREADIEWVYRPYMNTSKNQTVL
eukprot:TRINITY_DN773097_c0_g1_i1.p1 TRINITY_DN773097_c0_g1~~TRINITY_DN773097_c0_g1_i1.p1  ORF type:complete len:306 (+),score=77.62 TRINITY_DN773097_c0_g1_i1:56-919(+)